MSDSFKTCRRFRAYRQDMSGSTEKVPDWHGLQAAIAGDVVLPAAPDYDRVRQPPVALFDDTFLVAAPKVRPQAVVLCADPADVSASIAFARRYRLETAVRSGGHCFTGWSLSSGMVIDVSSMCSVSVTGSGLAAVGAGTRLGDLYDFLQERQLAIPAGSGSSVGIAGLTLGGGIGILGRRYGLTCDQLAGAQIVLADGRVVDCGEHRDRELFWALRGAGGGTFGVVTSFLFRTVPAPAATAFHLVWPLEEAAAVIDSWQRWAPDAPDEFTASVLITVPGDAGKPPQVNVFGAMLGTEPQTAGLLGELAARIGAAPATAAYSYGSFGETRRYLSALGDQFGQIDREGSQPIHAFSKSEFFRRPLPAEAIADLVGNLTRARVPGQSRELDCMPWGGAYNHLPAEATAFPHRDERFLIKHTIVIDPAASGGQKKSARRWLERSFGSVHAHGSGGVYPNFRDPDLAGREHAYYGTNHDRLRAAKRQYDPHNFFRAQPSLAAPSRASRKI